MNKTIILIAVVTGLCSMLHAQTAATHEGYNYSSFTAEKKIITPELQLLTDKQSQSHPEYGVLPFNAPCTDCFELLQKRDETHRYFVKNGSHGKIFYQQSAYSNLSFKEDGVLRTIDSRIMPATQQGVFEAKHQQFPVTINIPQKFTSILDNGKELQFNRNVSIFIKHSDGSITSLGEPDWTNYTAGDNGVVIHNFYPGIDLELRAGGGNIESFYRINKPLHLNDGWLVIRDNMKLPDGHIYDYSHSEKFENDYYAGTLYINNADGTHCFSINAPTAYDENNEIDNTANLNYQVADNGVYDLYVPINWMNDAKRSYPLIIDPLVMAMTTINATSINSSYNATCFSGGCATLMNVIVPPYCTIVDITTTFWYRAFNPCGINEGGWNITYGSCRFPADSSTWNTCGLPISGLCQLTNLNCDSDFNACLPAPSCNPAPMAFTLNFARCTASGAGCASSCIIGDIVTPTPWSVTVTGMTTEVGTVTADAPNNTICAGVNTNLTATTGGGVPPYTYTWYPGALTGNPVSVSPNATTTYTVTASTCGGADSASATITVTVDSCTGIRESYLSNLFSIYPNPANSEITLSSSYIHTNETITVSIRNVIGETIWEEKRKWNNQTAINIKSLPGGIYFVQVQNENGKWVERFVKE